MLSDIQEFIRSGAQKITPGQIAQFESELPMVLARIAEADPPSQPHLRAQAQFVVRYCEDCLDNKYEPNDVAALAESLFALMYLQKPVDIIPDGIPNIGYADDSAILRTVLMTHEAEFRAFGEKTGRDYSALTLEP